MSIRNGALVISSRVKKKFKWHGSLRLYLFVLFLLLGTIPINFMHRILTTSLLDQQLQSRMNDIQYQLNTLSQQILKAGYLDDPGNTVINAELSQLSDIYDGRVLVVDKTFRIIKDTYNADEGKTLIAEEVISCFKGQTKRVYNDACQYVMISMPVYDTEAKNVLGAIVVTTSTKMEEGTITAINRKMQVLESMVVFIVFVISLVLASVLVRPFRKIENAIYQASEGDMELIEAEDYLETKRIAEAYNKTLTRLNTLDQSRQEFVSNVSHELKTPITSIRVLADSLMTMEDAPVELYREFMSDISDEIDRESSIIEDLLTMVRLDKSNTELQVKQVNINELLELILKRLTPIAEKRDIELTLESFRPVIADIDEVKLTLALSNLVENAIKYNREEGWVRVTLNADHKFFYVKVQDSGVGIPEDAQQRIFERFYRVDKARSRETGGTGLGLAITQSIIQLHHGAIKVYSKTGEGTTFTVRIPLIYIA